MGPFEIDRERTTKAFNDDEMERIFWALRNGVKDPWFDRRTSIGKRNFGVIVTLLSTGCRSVSITRLLVGDVASRGGRVGLQLQNKKKPGAKRSHITTIWLSDEFADWIASMMRGRPGGNKAKDFVFCAINSNGKPMPSKPITGGAIQHIIRRFSNALGFPDEKGKRITSHRFRHSLATRMGEAGASLSDLCRQFGWSSFRMAEVYVSTEGEMDGWGMIRARAEDEFDVWKKE